MNICVQIDTPDRVEEISQVLDFLLDNRLIYKGAGLWCDHGEVNHCELRSLPEPPSNIDLDVVFYSHKPPLRDRRHARFFVGKKLPQSIERFCLPIEGKVIHARWLWHLLEEAERLSCQVRLLYSEHGLVVKEIIRLADWFHLDAVKGAVESWLDEDMKADFRELLEVFPQTEIVTSIGTMTELADRQDPGHSVLLGSLNPGPHFRGRYHGISYHDLLAHSGLCGYFLSESRTRKRGEPHPF